MTTTHSTPPHAVDLDGMTPLLKVSEPQHLITSVVLEPDVVDSQGHYETAETIEAAAHAFLARLNVASGPDEMHDFVPLADVGLEIVESWVTRADEVWTTTYGRPETVKAGSWVMTMHVLDEELWARVVAGELTGFSIAGHGMHLDPDSAPSV